MIADWVDDLELIKLYNGKILSSKGETTYDWAMAHYRLAQAMFRNQEIESGRRHAVQALELVMRPTSELEESLAKLVFKCWPEVSTWQK